MNIYARAMIKVAGLGSEIAVRANKRLLKRKAKAITFKGDRDLTTLMPKIKKSGGKK